VGELLERKEKERVRDERGEWVPTIIGIKIIGMNPRETAPGARKSSQYMNTNPPTTHPIPDYSKF
jgi:hypothetical protein